MCTHFGQYLGTNFMTRILVELNKYCSKFAQNFSTYTRVSTVLSFFGLRTIESRFCVQKAGGLKNWMGLKNGLRHIRDYFKFKPKVGKPILLTINLNLNKCYGYVFLR